MLATARASWRTLTRERALNATLREIFAIEMLQREDASIGCSMALKALGDHLWAEGNRKNIIGPASSITVGRNTRAEI